MMADRAELLTTFGANYGRLCALVGRALRQGHSQAFVIEAARGKGSQAAPVYVELRKARNQVGWSLEACKMACIPLEQMVEVARARKDLAESEWMMRLPSFSRTE